jgi:FkbM family methyltransferase
MDGDQKHYFGHRARGFSLYNKGISKRAKDIFDSYLLSKVDFMDEDIVVDCGANYGDLWLSLKGLIKPKNYITFEPSLDEYRSLTFNAADSIHNKLGLGNFDGKSKFYVNNGEADSCVIEPVRYSEIIEISLTKIDSYITLNAIEKIKLLKLEAEGFEPEILDGALKSLHKIEWIALDGGYERGVNMQETFSAATNTLLKNGFEMKGVIFHPSARALFRRL